MGKLYGHQTEGVAVIVFGSVAFQKDMVWLFCLVILGYGREMDSFIMHYVCVCRCVGVSVYEMTMFSLNGLARHDFRYHVL